MKSIKFSGNLIVFLVFLCSVNCSEPNKSASVISLNKNDPRSRPSDTIEPRPNVKDVALETLVSLEELISDILVDLKYATEDNFMHQTLYKNWKKAYLQKPIANKLLRAQKRLKELYPNYRLLVYDAARPVEIQRKMWFALDSIPPKERGKFVSSPYNKSLHNYGCAVDLTLCDKQGVPLDMGAGFDDIRKIAYPSMENYYLSTGEITREQVANRKLLRNVMRYAGFSGIATEWWHFNGCSKAYAKQHFKVIEREIDVFNK
jgi:D-alanyl-D-alanine dipeptidase